MKYLIISILFLTSILLKAQDSEPTQVQFYFNGKTDLLQKSQSYFQQNKFLLGWHWGGSYKISKALNINQYDGTSKPELHVAKNTNIFVKQDGIYTHCTGPELAHAKGIMFFPALKINPNTTNAFQTISGDTWAPVFGFRYRHDSAEVVPSQLTGLSAIKISSKIREGEVILQDPWPSNQLTFNEITDHKKDADWDAHEINYLGRELYFSINLRRTSSIIYTGANILKIELPYTYLDPKSTDNDKIYRKAYIHFDGIPDPNNNYDPKFRGKYQKTIKCSNDSIIYISAASLPTNLSTITLSAHFVLDGEWFNDKNRKLKTDLNLNCGLDQIDSLGIKITKGDASCPFEINWVKFETPNAREYFSGTFDQEIIDSVQKDLRNYDTNSTLKNNGARFFRIISHVEPGVQDWMSMRYFNKLVGDIVVNESGPYLPLHYNHYVNPSETWYAPQKFPTCESVPFMYMDNHMEPNNKWKSAGFICGYKFNPMYYDTQPRYYFDTLNSNYETWTRFRNYPKDFDTVKLKSYNTDDFQYAAGYISPQVFIESFLYKTFFTQPVSGFQYSDKPWWNQAFITTKWIVDEKIIPGKNTTYFDVNHRYTTGEELRYFTWNGIIMGAKGLFLDGPDDSDYSQQFRLNSGEKFNIAHGINNDSINDIDFLKRDDIGSDYLMLGQECDRFDENMAIDSICRYFKTDSNHIYLGRKSMRLELKKMYDWVHLMGDKLMNLRLMGWRGVGYKIWTNHNDSINYDPIARYIDTNYSVSNKMYLKDISDPNSIGSHPFFDLTIHKIKDTLLDTRFILGIQNRRTDPLLYEPGYFDNAIKFVPTAEFDEYVQNGGLNIPASKWQDFWWHRLGCRNIKVVLKKPDEYSRYRVTYRIKELAKGTSLDTNWWRDPKYMHVPDTTIVLQPWQAGATLSVRMLPGEGKMLEVVPKYENLGSDCMECESLKKNIKADIYKSNVVSDEFCYNITFTNSSLCVYDSLKFRLEVNPFLPKNLDFTPPYGWNATKDTLHNYIEISAKDLQRNVKYTFKFCSNSDPINKIELKAKNRFGEICDTSLFIYSKTITVGSCDSLATVKFIPGNCANNFIDSLIITKNPLSNKPLRSKIEFTDGSIPINQINDLGLNDTTRELIQIHPDYNTTYVVLLGDSEQVANGGVACKRVFYSARSLCNSAIKFVTPTQKVSQSNTVFPYTCKMPINIIADSSICNQRYTISTKNNPNLKTGLLSKTSPIAYDTIAYTEGVYTIRVYGTDGVTVCDSIKYFLCCVNCPRKADPISIQNPFDVMLVTAGKVSETPGIICTHIGIQANFDPQLAYGLVLFNTNKPTEKYYEEYRNPDIDAPFNLDGTVEITKICNPGDLPLRFTTAILDKDGSILAETAFDSTYVVNQNLDSLTVLSVTGEPNPTDGRFNISYSLSRNANTNILITDRFGVPVYTEDLGEVSAGLHRQNFDFSSLSNGTYYGIVRANGEAKSILFAVYK